MGNIQMHASLSGECHTNIGLDVRAPLGAGLR